MPVLDYGQLLAELEVGVGCVPALLCDFWGSFVRVGHF